MTLDGNYRGFEVATRDPGIAVITFNEPERLNGLSRGMKRDLTEIMSQAQLDADTRVVVITGSGRGFCAGDDIFNPTENDRHLPTLVPQQVRNVRNSQVDQYALLRAYSQELIRSILNLDKITIAALNGVAIQIGLSIALACDFRIASTEARLGSATLRFGFLPDEGGHWLLLRHLGLARSLEFLMRKQIVSAEQALDLGLITEMVRPEDLMPMAIRLAEEMATGPQVAMRMLKRSLLNAAAQTFEQAGDDIAAKTAVSDHHPDTSEGMAAYRERRDPRFNQWLEEPIAEDGVDPAWFRRQGPYPE